MACAQQVFLPKVAPNANVGDIAFDPATDRADFKRCGEGQYDVPQYYQSKTAYAGGTQALRQLLVTPSLPRGTAALSGYVTVRFLVNCHGDTDRFRVTQIDADYRPAQFSPALVAELLRRTKALHGWQPGHFPGPGAHQGEALDCYCYLMFKIIHGRVVDILP
ncbi:hypothetical protein [Hymenobacter sp. PAMC 26628]|uniref:hypothetical protein n=1 Tax=Hymenobacter sp. PAMC 26628 TaxID=1484118 RepID=UPI0007701551|nr:hypothetical protein [Hymenobacter sp. PAMC 26628]AMJ66364.1 hypothetical protein AXW84_13675 [Hymenobacter sp. PAMC 26628]